MVCVDDLRREEEPHERYTRLRAIVSSTRARIWRANCSGVECQSA
jgi:hypothetical protein